VEWNEWHLLILCIKCNSCFILRVSHTTTGNCSWNYKIFHVARVVKQLLNHFLEILIEQIQWQTSLLIFREMTFQVTSVTSQLVHIFSLTLYEMFFQIQKQLWQHLNFTFAYEDT
jgi:hypothetical protein